MKKFSSIIKQINEVFGKISSWVISVLVLVICIDVLLRYAFNSSNPAISEFEWHLYSFVILLAMGFTLIHQRHVRVDVFYHRFSPKFKLWVDLLGTLILLIPFCIIMIKSSLPYAEYSFNLNEKSPDPGGLPFRWIIKYCIPLGFFLLLLQALNWLVEILLKLIPSKRLEEKNG